MKTARSVLIVIINGYVGEGFFLCRTSVVTMAARAADATIRLRSSGFQPDVINFFRGVSLR